MRERFLYSTHVGLAFVQGTEPPPCPTVAVTALARQLRPAPLTPELCQTQVMIIQAIIFAYHASWQRTFSSISSIRACQVDHQPPGDQSRHPTHLFGLQGPE